MTSRIATMNNDYRNE